MNTNISGPLISLIVPVYNVKDYLKTCLQSILEQTYKNLEIILVDDGSDDGSSGICDEYARMDQRIKTIHLPHSGVSAARNAGLAAVRESSWALLTVMTGLIMICISIFTL